MNKIGFIGLGKMAGAIIKGIINSGLFDNGDIMGADTNVNALNKIRSEYGIYTTESNKELVQNVNIVVLAVKPFVLREVLEEIKPYVSKDQLIISIAAGISTKTIEEYLGQVSIIRVMPNTPALVNAGMSAVCKGCYVSDSQVQIAVKIFESVGEVIESKEEYIDIITAISGSGPAFYYKFIDDMAKSGERLGMDYKTCLKLSAQTALGSAKMIMESGIEPEQLIINVTTPGGCTAVGNEVLKENNISDIIFDTIEKTKEKAFELGKK